MIEQKAFTRKYFLEEAKKFRAAVNLPLVYVGGLNSRTDINEVLAQGFELVAMARAPH